MAIIAVAGGKGGTGKSTDAINLAVICKQNNKDVFLYDLDQITMSSTLWASLRDENNITPRIPCAQKIISEEILNKGAVVRNDINELKRNYDDIILDLGAGSNELLKAALTLADIAVFPMKPIFFDVATLRRLNILVSEAKLVNPNLVAKVHWNMVSPRPNEAKSDLASADETLKDFECLGRFKTESIQRGAVAKAQREGLSVVEYNPEDDKAIKEIMNIYEEIFDGK